MYCGVTGPAAKRRNGLRQLADAAGMNPVVVFFQIIRVLIHISRIVRFNRIIREMACGTTFPTLELTLKGRVVSVRGIILNVPSLLSSFCLLTAAPHGVTPFCTRTGGGHLWLSVRPRNVWSICRTPRLHAFGGRCLPACGSRGHAGYPFPCELRTSRHFSWIESLQQLPPGVGRTAIQRD